MLITAGILTLLIWLYLFFLHGQFWRISKIVAAPRQSTQTSMRIAVVIPARDEADVVGSCITSLLRQNGNHLIHVFLVDDASSDATAQVACKAARAAARADDLTVIGGRPLPPGWSGKLWAVQQGVEQALALNPDFLLFTDADIAHGPNSLTTLVAIAQSGSFDLVSFMVKLYCRTLAERALIPAFVFFFLKLYPPAWISSDRFGMAGAAGGSILIRPAALERAGGIAAIRREIIDDCALARRAKESGGRIWLGLSAETQSIRSYGSFSEIGRMISRGAFNQLRHSAFMLAVAVAGLTATYLLPPLLAIFSHRLIPSLLGAAAWLLMAACFLPTVRFYRLNPLWVLALPLIAVFYMGASVHSAVRFWSGRGGQWKGRIQDPAGKMP